MRPIDKGPCPTDAEGNPKTVPDYTHWRADLIERIGEYCAYCNMPINHSLNVEHVVPKNPQPGELSGGETDWENVLLACLPCNTSKGNQPTDPTAHYLPESHNTLLAFSTSVPEHGHSIVIPHPSLPPDHSTKADVSIRLFGLQKIDKRPNVVDLRSKKRWQTQFSNIPSARQVFEMAKNSPTFDVRTAAENIKTQALSSGFFALWFEAFRDEPEIMKVLVILPGTAEGCFDGENGYQPIPRNPSNHTDPF